MTPHTPTPTPLEQLFDIAMGRRSMTLGLPSTITPAERAAAPGVAHREMMRYPSVDKRCALTPEGAAMLIERGITVCMERGAGQTIRYPDHRYSREGVRIVSRAEALAADIVVHLSPITAADARQMRRGAVLLTMLNATRQSREALQVLLERHIVSVALDLVKDMHSNSSFSDILDEIEGRAAIAVAQNLLIGSNMRKGILLGGIAGIIPCEVTILGAGIAGVAAARSALGLGALVRLFDDNIYRLREATQKLGAGVAASAMHPHVLQSALQSADVVVATHLEHPCIISKEMIEQMKQGVLLFNLNKDVNVFADTQACSYREPRMLRDYHVVRPAEAVPRTVAMAMSNTIVSMFDDMLGIGGDFYNAIKFFPGLQSGVFTYMGKIVNARLASALGTRHVDINLLLQYS